MPRTAPSRTLEFPFLTLHQACFRSRMRRQAMITVIRRCMEEAYERMRAAAENVRYAYTCNYHRLIQKR